MANRSRSSVSHHGGALVDAFDRRKVALATAAGMWLCSGVLLAQALLDIRSVGLLCAVVAVQSALFAVNNPARQSIIPRLLPTHLLPARMTFVMDLCAMVFAQPRTLFPALALTVYAGNASTLGILQAAQALGALVAFGLSGWIGASADKDWPSQHQSSSTASRCPSQVLPLSVHREHSGSR